MNGANGNIEWQKRYDHNHLNELPASIFVDDSGNNITVTGASANSLIDWDMVTVVYNDIGVELNVNRVDNPVPGFDQPTAVEKDNQDNLFITGNRSTSANGYDICTMKFDSDMNLQWEECFDGMELLDNAYDIKLDNSGNIYVCGTTEKPNGGKDFLLIKYNSSGNIVWHQRRQADKSTGIAIARKIQIDTYENVIVAGDIEQDQGSKAIVVTYNAQGEKLNE